MSTPNPLIDIPATQYYFDTFVIGAHHSVPHMISDLLKRREIATLMLDDHAVLEYRRQEYRKLIQLIDAKLLETGTDELADLELAEPVYWVNELARKSSIEINTYGRIRPDTLELLLCLSEDDFKSVMKIAAGITSRIQQLAAAAEVDLAPLPDSMPRT